MATSEAYQELRKRCEGRLAGLRVNRYSFWAFWSEIALYWLPRRYKWLITPNQASRGSDINQRIINNTGVVAARTLAGGLQGGLTNPMTPWFKFKIQGYEDESSNVVQWLAECAKRMQLVFQESNFYNAMAVMYWDLIVFGTAVVLIYEDYDNVINCYNPCLGEFYTDVSHRLENNVVYREFVRTIEQIVSEFGIENCPDDVKRAYDEGGVSWTRERVLIHALEPNVAPTPLSRIFKYREVYWVAGSGRSEILRCKGYHEFPGFVVRWDTVGNDSYGRSSVMDAHGDNKQLQQEEKRKAQGIDKMVNPPMVASIEMQNRPASGLPGGVTYVAGLSRERPGFAPAYQVMPNVAELRQDINAIENRIKATLFNNLFMDISNLQTVRSATEIEARREEKLLMLPVIKRLDKEALAPAIERVWAIMMRGGLFPPDMPPEVRGQLISVKYISAFAMAMLAAETTAIERLYSFGGNLAAAFAKAGGQPDALDNFDSDSAIHIYGDAIGADPRVLRKDSDRDAMRQARAQQQQSAQAMQNAGQAVQGAQVLSQTPVGGGQNALERVLGGGQGAL